jgi:hypothetical protein
MCEVPWCVFAHQSWNQGICAGISKWGLLPGTTLVSSRFGRTYCCINYLWRGTKSSRGPNAPPNNNNNNNNLVLKGCAKLENALETQKRSPPNQIAAVTEYSANPRAWQDFRTSVSLMGQQKMSQDLGHTQNLDHMMRAFHSATKLLQTLSSRGGDAIHPGCESEGLARENTTPPHLLIHCTCMHTTYWQHQLNSLTSKCLLRGSLHGSSNPVQYNKKNNKPYLILR